MRRIDLPKFFVWLSTQTGPQPQIWHDDEPKNGEGKEKYSPLLKVKLQESEFDYSLKQLAYKYPAPT